MPEEANCERTSETKGTALIAGTSAKHSRFCCAVQRNSAEGAMATTIKVNSADRTIDVDRDTRLLWKLRDVETRLKSFSARLAKQWHRNVLFGLCVALLSAAGFALPAAADESAPTQSLEIHTGADIAPWDRQTNAAAKQADAWFENYKFRDGETITRLRIHYATLGEPHRNADGNIDNAVLVLHWTGADGLALLSPAYMEALFDVGRPLDARRYYLIFPDNVGHGQSSKPSDGLKAKFPNYGYRDIVDLQHKLVTETLGINHLHAILGMSMGGMNAWQWAEAYPDAMDGVMPVVSLPIKVSGRNMLWRRMVINDIRSDPEWNGGNYTKPSTGWLLGYEILRMMIDGVPHLQATVPDGQAADRIIEDERKQAEAVDANDILYSLKSSADYDPEPGLTSIRTKVFALNFDDDEFNPEMLHVLERLMTQVPHGRFIVQSGSETSFGHLTMAHPELWAQHVGEFMQWLGDTPLQVNQAR
jgi:homoserine O-acetyltransferase/O-succinyltransferase